MGLDERQKLFIGYLCSLAKKGQEDRGALADLRSGLGKRPEEMARIHRYVVPYLPDKNYNDRWYYLIATLFGYYPEHRGNYSLGKAFKPLRTKSTSMETRFIALLNAHYEDLDKHLRYTVSLLKANEQPLDWFQLFQDLLQWDSPEGHVQLRWARDFFSVNSSDENTKKQTIGEENNE
jgi:CRISPR type I-E/ECOLI-associated protein CasB/Cse2